MIISQPNRTLFTTIMLLAFIVFSSNIANKKQRILALYIPLAVETSIIPSAIDIDAFADTRFNSGQ